MSMSKVLEQLLWCFPTDTEVKPAVGDPEVMVFTVEHEDGKRYRVGVIEIPE